MTCAGHTGGLCLGLNLSSGRGGSWGTLGWMVRLRVRSQVDLSELRAVSVLSFTCKKGKAM